MARKLCGRTINRVFSEKPGLKALAEKLSGRSVTDVFCKGKHIFIRFDQGTVLHNHMLMRGKWRALSGPFLFAPPGLWLALEQGASAICNFNGQVLEAIDEAGVAKWLDALGPDVLSTPYPEAALAERLQQATRPICEVLLDQSCIAGIGNVAKSESLFLAGIDPRIPANQLSSASVEALLASMRAVMMESYTQGGRWIHRVYHRHRQPCPQCGGRIAVIRMPPSRRATYFCPLCQRG